jgi:hypothetical protein
LLAQNIGTIHKVKSHLSYQQAVARDMGQWWQGNAYVDDLARQAARRFAMPVQDAKGDVRSQHFASAFLRELVKALLG